MNTKLLSYIFFITVLLSSCTNDNFLSSADMTDTQLIQAIQQANKQEVDAVDLPSNASAVLSNEFSQSLNQKTELASELGYQVLMVRTEGIRIGESSDVYFNLNGRELREDNDRDDDDRDDDDRDDDGDDDDREDDNRDDDGRDIEECFDLVYPVTFVMPDGTEITGDTEEEVFTAIRDWQVNNDDFDEGPELQYPVDIAFEDGSILTVNNDEEMLEAKDNCSDLDYECPDLEANIGDDCRDSDGNIGVVDSDCECDLN